MSSFDAGEIARALGASGNTATGGPFSPPPPPSQTSVHNAARSLGYASEQSLLQQEMKEMTDRVEKHNLRSLQRQSYLCSAKCCEDDDSTAQQFQRCMKTCSLPVERANNIIQSEMQRFQNRIQRCVMDCQDQAQDEQGHAVQADIIQSNFTQCTERCFAQGRSGVQSLGERLQSTMVPQAE